METKELIRREYFLKRKSIRQISREQKRSRKTVRKAIRDPSIPIYTRKKPPSFHVMDAYIEIVERWLKEDESRPRKQRHTAKRVYERLRDEHGYEGTDRTVRNHVRRLKAKTPDSHVPQVYERADGGTYDFGEAQVVLAGEPVVVQLAFMRLDYSSKFFVFAMPTQRLEALMESHVRGFTYLEGVARRMRYDNMKTAVKKVLRGRNRREQEKWVAFRSHFLFESEYCNLASGQEKGGVENLVGYFRRNFLVPIPRFEGYADLNRYLLDCCEQDALQRRRSGKIVQELWEEERSLLLSLPCPLPDTSVPTAAQVNRRQLVRFDRNWYSVPAEAIGKSVTVHAHVFHIVIGLAEKVIARHDRSYGRQEHLLDPHHYLPVLLRKPGAFTRAMPIVNWKLPDIYRTYHDHLRKRHEGWRGTREFIQVLMLLRQYPQDDVTGAIEIALQNRIFSYDGLKNLLLQSREPDRVLEEPCRIPRTGVLPNQVEHFDQLLQP